MVGCFPTRRPSESSVLPLMAAPVLVSRQEKRGRREKEKASIFVLCFEGKQVLGLLYVLWIEEKKGGKKE